MSQPVKHKKLPLPPGWIAFPSRNCLGKVYFFHQQTGQSLWKHEIAQVFDLGKADDIGLIGEENNVIQKKLESLTYIPTKIERKPSIDDNIFVRPTSPLSSPKDHELRSTHCQNTLESHLNSLSKPSNNSFYSDCYSPNSFPQYSTTEVAAGSISSDLIDDPVEPQKNNVISKSKIIPDDLYSGYQSHICSPPVSNNNSFDESSDSSSYLSSREYRSTILNRAFSNNSPTFSPLSDSNASPQSTPVQYSIETENCCANIDQGLTSPRDSSESPSDSPSTHKRRNRDKFELEAKMSNPGGYFRRRERRNIPPLFESPPDQLSGMEGLRKNEIWKHMDSSKPSTLNDRIKRAQRPCDYNEFLRQSTNFHDFRPPENLVHRRELERNNTDCQPSGWNGSSDWTRRSVDNRKDWNRNKPSPNYEHDGRNRFNGHRGNSLSHSFPPNDRLWDRSNTTVDRHRHGSAGRPTGPYIRSSDNYPNQGRWTAERTQSRSKMQERLSRVQEEVRNRDDMNAGTCMQNRSIFSPDLTHPEDICSSTHKPALLPTPNIPPLIATSLGTAQRLSTLELNNPAHLPTPNDLLTQFSKERPDVVQMPKHSPSSDRSDKDSPVARKRKAISFERKTDSPGSANRGHTSFESASPTTTNREFSFNETDLPMFLKKIKRPSESPFFQKETIVKTEFPNPTIKQEVKSPTSFNTRKTSFQQSDYTFEKPESLKSPIFFEQSDSSIKKESIFENTSSSLNVSNEGDMLKKPLESPSILKLKDADPERQAAVKVVKFKEAHEERLFDVESGDFMSAEEKQMMAFDLCNEPKNGIDFSDNLNCSENQQKQLDFSDRSDNFINRSESKKVDHSKNLAQQRLNNIRKSQKNEEKSGYPKKRYTSPPPDRSLSPKHVDTDLSPINCAENYSCNTRRWSNEEEPMEWEDIPVPEIMSKVNETRLFLSMCPQINRGAWIPQVDTAPAVPKADFCIVLDTNILLSGLSLVASLRDTKFKELGLPIIVIPWQVMQEIDSMKDSYSKIQRKAIYAKNFLYENFSNEHPRVRGQSMKDWQDSSENPLTPDDSILLCAMRLKEKGCNVMFVTDDQNLYSKAKINGIECYNKKQMQSKVIADQEREPVIKKISVPESVSEKTVSVVDELICALKNTLLEYFCTVIKKGMIGCFGEDMWFKRCAIKPPWTSLSNCLMLLDKHSCSIMSNIIPLSSFTKAVKEVQCFFVDQEKGRKMEVSAVMMALKAILRVVEFLKDDAYKHESLPIVEYLEAFRKKLASSCCSPSKSDCSSSSSLRPYATPPNITDLTAVASTSQTSPTGSNNSMVVCSRKEPALNTEVVQSNSALLALNISYYHCKNFCASMCTLLKIPYQLQEVKIVEKELVEFKEDLPEYRAFVNFLVCSFQSIIDAQKDGDFLSPESDDIKEIGRTLQEFLVDQLNVSEVQIMDVDTFLFFTEAQYEIMRKTGRTQLEDLRKLFVKCSNEFKKMNIY